MVLCQRRSQRDGDERDTERFCTLVHLPFNIARNGRRTFCITRIREGETEKNVPVESHHLESQTLAVDKRPLPFPSKPIPFQVHNEQSNTDHSPSASRPHSTRLSTPFS